jgi:hypothetical protein
MWNYITSLAATALALLELAKDWKEQKKTSRRTAVLGLIMLSGIAGALSTYYSARDAEKQHSEDQARIARLQASIDKANETLNLIAVTMKLPQLKQETPSGPLIPTLSWEPNEPAGVVGYNIYRSRTSGGPYVKLNSAPLTTPFYEDTTVTAGSTYYYVSTAIDSRGTESPFSNERQVVVPAR